MKTNNSQLNKKERSKYLDNLCCLLTIHMIFIVHVAYSSGKYDPEFIKTTNMTLSFFMSWFFFKGGMMHKVSDNHVLTKKAFDRLLIPFIIFLIVGFFIDLLLWVLYSDSSLLKNFIISEIKCLLKTTSLPSVLATWFLICLFVVRVLFNILCKKINSLIIASIAVILAYLVYLTKSSLYPIPYYIGTIFHGLFVYSMGNFLKEFQFKKSILFLATIIFVLKFFHFANIDFRANDPHNTNYLLGLVYGISGCIVFNNLFKLMFNKKIKTITHIGENSMIYYLVHYPIMIITIRLCWNPLYHLDISLRYLIISSIILISLIISDYIFRNKKLRFIIGG